MAKIQIHYTFVHMKMSLLDRINYPKDLRRLHFSDLSDLADELRQFVIDAVAVKEGHLGASLGVIELTIALHYLFDTPRDILIWDVGHQAYGHKILTGRKSIFHTNRELGGLSGFPSRSESIYDAFGTGHSSTSISAALGMAVASQLKGDFETNHIAIIGDASITSGMAFEALNHAGATNTNLWVILNDNAMGIDPSVGALKNYFFNLKDSENPLISAFNFYHKGPIDGHNFQDLFDAFSCLKDKKGPKFLHVRTIKGKGLKSAELEQVIYHAPGKFNRETGDIISKNDKNKFIKYQDVFGKTLVELAEENKKIVAITPAMLTGSSLKHMMAAFPNRCFDVGIAEQHAVTFSAGLATQGFIPYCVIYSTFLQRAYDQIIHDVALQKLPVIFCIDRAGVVGEDGATHHGVFDIAFLRGIPNLIICSPRNEIELRNILFTASLSRINQAIAIRYPRGFGHIEHWQKIFSKIEIGKGECISEGDDIAVLSIGTTSKDVSEAIKLIPNKSIGHYDMRFVKPLDESLLHHIFKKYESVITVEDGIISGGFGSAIIEFMSMHNYQMRIKRIGVSDSFIPHGSVQLLKELYKIDDKHIAETIKSFMSV